MTVNIDINHFISWYRQQDLFMEIIFQSVNLAVCREQKKFICVCYYSLINIFVISKNSSKIFPVELACLFPVILCYKQKLFENISCWIGMSISCYSYLTMIYSAGCCFCKSKFISWFVAVWLGINKTGNVAIVILNLFCGLFLFYLLFVTL